MMPFFKSAGTFLDSHVARMTAVSHLTVPGHPALGISATMLRVPAVLPFFNLPMALATSSSVGGLQLIDGSGIASLAPLISSSEGGLAAG